MTHDDAFLQTLRENPGDDVTRFVYADWLEECGDPRARYIRLELQLVRLPVDDLLYRALESELQALRCGIDPDWLAVVGKRYRITLRAFRLDSNVH